MLKSLRQIALVIAVLAGCSSSPTEDSLKSAPHVARVDARGPSSPAKRVLHILDWHYIEKEQFALDTQLDGEELDQRYKAHLALVDAIQQEQMELLEYLIEQEGIEEVYIEALTSKTADDYQATCKILKEEESCMPSFRAQIQQLKDILAVLEADDQRETEQYAKAKSILAEFEDGMDDRRAELTRVGAAGRLFVEGKLKRVLPAEDVEAYNGAAPIDGKIDQAKQEEREAAIVKILAQSPAQTVVLMLGGANDLRDKVPKDWRYVRIAQKKWLELVEAERR